MLNIDDMCSLMIGGLTHSKNREYLSAAAYVREYRTVGLIAQRKSGKTTFLEKFHRKTSSMLFTHMDTEHSVSFSMIESLMMVCKGVNLYGLKYSCFLVDDFIYMTPSQSRSLYNLIDSLAAENKLNDDFFVLKLGT